MKFKVGLISLITLASVGVATLMPGNGQAYADTASTCPSDATTSTDVTTTPTNTATCSSPTATTDSSTTPSDPITSSATDPSRSSSDNPSGTATDSSTTSPACPTDTSSGSSSADPTSSTSVNNCDQSSSTSGSAEVSNSGSSNTSTSGSADSSLNLINSANSTTGPAPVTFTDNVYGNQNGNIVVDPNSISPSTSSPSYGGAVNSTSLNGINNTDTLVANSGSSIISGSGNNNTSTSGNAAAIANVVNLIDSVISSGQSFEGTINIYGNLYGDISLPASLISQLIPIGANTGLTGTSLQTALISNNVTLTSASGQALIADSGNGNTATTGSAQSILNLTNYINSYITASNLFLVIVNVQGVWQGYMLGQLPSGNSAVYMLGTGVTNNYITQPNSNLTGVNNSYDVINNNINLVAYSGNASVINSGNNNTATSGNALALANLVNFEFASINLSGWFGVLFINIFGNWYGSLATFAPVSADPITVDAQPQILGSQPVINNVAAGGGSSFDHYTVYAVVFSLNTNQPQSPEIGTNAKIVSDKTSPKAESVQQQKGVNYLLLVLSLLPLVALAVYEKRHSSNK